MFDRHRAEITVTQFTGHSLPVHQFVTVPWDFNPVPAKLAYATVFGMACLAGLEVNIQQYAFFFICTSFFSWDIS